MKMKNKSELDNFLNDFMSPTERTVLFKRLAVAVLLAKGNDYRSISDILRVTPITISKMSFRMKYGNGSVKKISEKIMTKDKGKAILEELTGIFDNPIKERPRGEYRKNIWERNKKIRKLRKEI